ncbi:MAG: radical SAM/SPASM domain-containing protein [Paraclostridium sordellii]|uniref:Radical SAM domain-containing protein n=1 Tax=Paraclostridium sordellii TaxID=1505 RepID=A0A0C7LBI0_PARSO|nr:radical SAM protein [Paeniclostridium sordellii]CEP41807.1 radical SAM domain-containing protein [[Clostridium] sordellii] [Paeniclostridium sordellii]
MQEINLSKEKIKFVDEDLIIYEKNRLVLIYSKKNKKHIFQSKEVYDYFVEAIKENLTFRDFIELFSDDDKTYIKQLINDMIKVGILYINEDTRNLKKNSTEIETIYLATTHRCNLECRHCCTSCNSNEKDILTTKEIFSIIDFIITLNPREIILTGGEPLIRKDFKEMVEYIKSYSDNNVNLVLSTNGTLINDNNIDFIVDNFHRIEISIDGVDEETCGKVRGKGVFGKIISNIRKLQEKNFNNIRTSMIFGDKNEYLSESFEKLNSDLGTQALPRCFEPVGRGKDNVLEFLSEDTILPITLAKKLEKVKDRNYMSSCSCDLYEGKMFIDSDGKIYPCQSLMKDKYSLGNILAEETKEKLLKFKFEDSMAKQNIKKIYPYNYEKCKDCDVNIFCMYCPGLIDTVLDNEQEFNKWCGLMKPQLNRIIWGEEC